MKKPHALIGLLAAAGTTIGVLVAVFGLPYGRMNYTAFAGLYHNGGTPVPVAHFEMDCDTTLAGTQNLCLVPQGSTRAIGLLMTNGSAGSVSMPAYQWEININDTLKATPATPVDGDLNFNPDHNSVAFPGAWSCATVPPVLSTGEDGPGTNTTFQACFIGTGPVFASGVTTLVSTYTVNIAPAATGLVNLSFEDLSSGDNDGNDLVICNPGPGLCFGATLDITAPPTNTPTNTATNTPTATNTATPTNTPLGASIVKIPEGNENNVDLAIPAANLWICVTGPCSGPGEGNLIVFEYATNVLTGDFNGDTITDGLGAYEFDIEYDNFVIQSVNPSDVVFNPTSPSPYPTGADAVLDGEGAARAPASCGFSLIFENVVHFGCVTAGQVPGPTGAMDIARLNLIPHPDLTNDIFPGNDNGVVTVLKDNGCELVDTFGHPTVGSVGGGLTAVCGDLAVTVRILEGDLNLDCVVDVQDQQLIAWRYASFFGSLLYSQWYDLEPNLHDLDIDIKDLQKVFGRDGSTCQVPIQPQPPIGPPAPFGN